MKRLSSIFSFSTLRGFHSASKATALAIVLIALTEGAAQWALRSGRIHEDPSLHALIWDHRRDVQRHRYDVWMLGNSMLQWGVDPAEFRKLTGQSAAVLSHGSATPRASVTLLRYYLKNTKYRPKTVLLFCGEDDTNRNGIRADESQRYIDYVEHNEKPKWHERLALFSARGNITTTIEQRLGGVAELPVMRKHFRTGDEEFDPGDRTEVSVSAFAQKLLKKFKFDDGVITNLRKTARHFHVKHVAVVVVPTTDVNARCHDKLVPKFTCAQIRAYIAKSCAKEHVAFMNPGEPSKMYQNFRDSYHLNNTGRQRYTNVLAAWYLAHYRPTAPAEPDPIVRQRALESMNALGLAIPDSL